MGVAIGDILGQPFEGQTRSQILSQFSNLEDFLGKKKTLFNTFTDDTQLTLHTAQALINGNGFNLKKLIKQYIKWLDDPPIRPGYGSMSSIQKLKYGLSVEKAASNSGGNGTIMRVSPIGLFFNNSLMQLKNAAILSSKITHSHPAAHYGAVIIARAIAYLIKKSHSKGFIINNFMQELVNAIQYAQDDIAEEFINVLKKVEENLDLSIETGLIKFSQIGVKSPYYIEMYMGKAFVHPYAMSTVACSLFLFLKHRDSFKNCLYELATAGGDTDTVGAIGGSLAGAYFGFDEIPENLINLVKDKKKILQIAEQLHEKYQQNY